MKKILLLGFVLISACQHGMVSAVQPTDEQRMTQLIAATVQINISCPLFGDGSGSGVIISTTLNGTSKILTAGHLLPAPECTLTVVTRDGKEYPTKVIKVDQDVDLMLLDVDAALGTFTPVAAYSYLGQPVTVVGFPAQLADGMDTHLTVSRGWMETDLGDLTRVSADIYFGNSGGAGFSDDNQVIGIVSCLYGFDIDGIGTVPVPAQFFLVSTKTINEFLKVDTSP